MIRLFTALILSLSHSPVFGAIERTGKQYYQVDLACWGATLDVVLSASGFYCSDDIGHRYYGYTVGGGVGGLITASRFQLYVRAEKGHPITGHYSGPSFAVGLGLGVGGGVFTRNLNSGWRPDLQAEEYIYAFGLHAGLAGDVSVNTLYLERI